MAEKKRADSSNKEYRMRAPVLGARLETAAKLVRRGMPAADIGCDHGKLAVWLALEGVCPRVVAVDVRSLPLARAGALVQRSGCGDIVECRLGNGLSALRPGEVKDIVMAGISGESMVQILSQAAWVRDESLRFIFVPNTRASHLRKWLWEEGFAILNEKPLRENGRYYTVLSVGYTGESRVHSPLEVELGAVAGDTSSAAQGYICQRLHDLKKRAHAPLPPPQRAALAALIQEVEACLQ